MSNNLYGILIILICSVVTVMLRALPFVIFPEGKPVPAPIKYLSDVFPGAVISMLVIYCLKSVSVIAYPFGLPELIAIVLTAGLHIWKRNTLLSILSGTVVYMLLIQFVF